MKKIIHTLLLLFFIINTQAQKNCIVQNANAFYSIVMPGNMPVDENGNQRPLKVHKSRTIFISSNCALEPLISKVIYDNTNGPFFIEKANKEEIANLMDDMNNKIKLNAPKSSFLWKITVVETGGIVLPENPKKIVLQWKSKNKINMLFINT